ncbi:VirB3 family type IV secretion system protein [Xanthobacter sp. V13C-7B]|uniref:type IV secretion system protein VirB3 n=1 Tax=Xanthobacter variabilis TaxID=3119932 RepID=UPI00372A2FF6
MSATAGQSELVEQEILFLACTRPAVFAGAPMETLPVNAAIGLLLGFILLDNFLVGVGITASLHMVSREIVKRDPNRFRLIAAWLVTTMRCLNRSFWGGSSVTPLQVARHFDERDYGL